MYNHSKNRRKRKPTTRSIISSKPSLHSNMSKAVVQAVPGVHDLNSKFVRDPRRVETYYAKPQSEEYTTPSLPTNV